mgnify:CR=1 FL=1
MRHEGAPPVRARPPSRSPDADRRPARLAAVSESNRPLRVLMVASECLPLSKSGGLADVVAALPVALARRGHHVRIVVPRYRGVACDRAPVATIEVAVGPRAFRVPIYEHRLHDAVRVWLVDEPTLFGRTSMYGEGQTDYTDNALRFALLSKAALQCAITQAFRPHVVHAHDWHAGLVPLYMRTAFADSTLGGAASVFTIHNLAYQGLFDPSWLRAVGIDPRYYHADGLEYWGRISFLKAGINYCDRLTTVSPGYAREMQTPAGGFGFDGIVRRRAECLTGIPTTDAYLDAHFSIDTLDEKRHCKRALLERFAFTQARAVTRPVVGMVSRMVDQKGLDLIAGIASALPHLDATIVVHGTGEARYEEMWRNLAARWPDRIGVVVGFDERLAHLEQTGERLDGIRGRVNQDQFYHIRPGRRRAIAVRFVKKPG